LVEKVFKNKGVKNRAGCGRREKKTTAIQRMGISPRDIFVARMELAHRDSMVGTK
jgi:hypothetical protein